MTEDIRSMRHEEVPKTFEVCFNEQCPRHADCVHYAAGQVRSTQQETGPCIYPTALRDGQCRHFRRTRLMRVAYGFKTLFRQVRHEDYDRLRTEVIYHFGSASTFWRYNRGHYKLTPEQQEEVLDIFRRRGYDTTDFRFAHYVDMFDFQ